MFYICGQTNFFVIVTQYLISQYLLVIVCVSNFNLCFLGICYRIIEELLTWDVAREKCHRLNAELISIHSQQENDFVYSKIIFMIENSLNKGIHIDFKGVFEKKFKTIYVVCISKMPSRKQLPKAEWSNNNEKKLTTLF